jgi:molybdopterin/thiamine biosynthesis adenylyltransferase
MAQFADGYAEGLAERHIGILSDQDQRRLRESTICGAGTGGVGGWTYEALARAGCGRFRIADPDVFSPSNGNRQLGCDATTVGRNKAEVTAERLQRVHPGAEIEVFPEGVTEANVDRFVAGGNLVLDGIDLPGLRMKKRLYDAARAAGIPVLSCPILGFGAALAIFDPKTSPTFEEYFGTLPPEGDAQGLDRYLSGISLRFFALVPKLDWTLQRERGRAGLIPSIGTAAMLSGAMAATAGIAILCGKGALPVVPRTLHVDLMEGKMLRMGPGRRWVMKKLVGLVQRARKDA